MAEEQKEPQGEATQTQQVTKEPHQVTQVTKEPQRVITKNLKKVEAGKRLAAHNHRRREEQRKEQAKLEKTASRVNKYYGIGAIALGVIGGLGYYIYRSKKGEVPNRALRRPPLCRILLSNHAPRRKHRPTSLRWIKSILYYKNGQEEYSK